MAGAIHTWARSQLADACESPLPDDTAQVWFTDPPYYDAVPYADLVGFLFRMAKASATRTALLRDPFDPENTLTPKTREIVQDEIEAFRRSN